MNRIMRSLAAPAVGFFVAVSPELTLAQPDGAAFDMTWPVGAAAMAGALPPAEILAEVRREGFYPIGRPVQRGRVYVLFAVDQDDMDVKLTVDAASGQVLWVAGVVAHFGGPGYYGYRSIWRSERPPVPPVEVPIAGPSVRNSAGSAGTRHHASMKPPLPRIRPANLAGAAAKDSVPPAQNESAVAVQPGAAPPLTMVPVAPLE
jgi:hypothetical protein